MQRLRHQQQPRISQGYPLLHQPQRLCQRALMHHHLSHI